MRLFFVFPLVWGFVTISPGVVKPVKRALIIAVGDYDFNRTGWRRINSANDARILEPMLKQRGFVVEVVLNPDKPTILKALQTLEQESQPGDVLLVHISAHGVGVTDDNGDEADGLDETIVPIDAPDASKMPVGYKGEKHLRDDQLGEWLTKLRQRIGSKGDLLVLLDACHSGTGTRGASGVVRGSTEPLRLAGFPAKSDSTEDPSVFFELPTGSDLSAITVIAAAQANHLNFEDPAQQCGSLTSAFCSVMNEAGGDLTYQALFDRIMSRMALFDICYLTGQRPELESTQADRTLFGGQKIVAQQTFPIVSLNPTEQRAVVNGGNLVGIYIGTQLKLYKAGDNPTLTKALDSAVVVSAGSLQSEVEFAGKVPIKRAAEGQFHVSHRVFRDDTLFINIDSLPPGLRTTMHQLSPRMIYPVAFRSSGYDVSAISNRALNADMIGLRMNSSGQLYPEMSADLGRLLSGIEQLYLAKSLRRITLKQDDIAVNWSLERRPNPSNDTTTYLRTWKGKLYARQAKSGYFLRVQNRSRVTIWYNILDFQPDGVYRVHWPQPTTQEEGYRLEPGQRSDIPFGLSKPFGNEMFKLFSATSPLNLRPLVSGQARGPQPDDAPLTRFLKNRLTSRGPTYPENAKEGKTLEMHYVIEP